MIRLATEHDADAVVAIWNHIIADTTHSFTTTPKTKDGITTLIADLAQAGRGLWVAELDDGTIAGFACYDQFRGGNGYARTMEHSIHLASKARGKGLGRALMAAVEAHAKAGGAHQIIAGVSGENTDGQAFHAAVGYVVVGRIPEAGWKWGRALDLVLMQKILT